jgi:molecular chaperone GrpE
VLLESNDSDAAKEGTELIYNKLMNYLKSKGLAVIEAMDQPFDTDLHEAVAQFPVQEDEKKGRVFDVVQTGYTLNGKVIRFAKVVVGLARGRKAYDKREYLKENDAKREMDKAMKRYK